MRKINLKKTVFKTCTFHEADFSESDLSGAIFDGCDFDRATFSYSILESADFRTSFHYIIDPETNKIKKAKFSRTEVAGLLHKYDIEID
jgi:uncharacterized protein YjbI with pentapeptide repeats